MAVDWTAERARRQHIMDTHGQYIGVYNRNWEPVLDIEDLTINGEFPATLMDTGSMSLTLPGEIKYGVRSPVVDYLLNSELDGDEFDTTSINALDRKSVV